MDKEKQNDPKFDDDVMSEIRKSLASQISKELDGNTAGTNEEAPFAEEKKKIPKWLKITGISFGAVAAILLIAFLVLDIWLGKVNFTDWGNTKQQAEEFEQGEGIGEKVDPNSVIWDNTGIKRQDKNVVNILLVGEEAINDGAGRGRTDSIMIASMNVKQKSVKLTSLMRDMYVQIPGYSDNKLNAAYHNGGMPLLKETVQTNFDIELDGAVLVNFDGFEKIIDRLGGVEITLSESEANYLNTTNYISNPAYRNVKVGKQTLNGNQALGYSRVRYRKATSGEANDFGRTSRQRTVLNAIFEKYKSKNPAELIVLLNDILPMVTTDISKSELMGYMATFVTFGSPQLQTLRIPLDNEYTNANIRSMDVLLPNFPANVDAMHTFIFGSTNVVTTTDDTESDTTNSTTDTNSTN